MSDDGLGQERGFCWPVAETRDVQICRPRPGPCEPVPGDHRQNHRRAGGRARALGSALGQDDVTGTARRAEERCDRAAVFGDKHHHPMVGSDGARLLRPELADLPPGALAVGGHVRKGEKGTTVVYADRFTPDAERRRAEEDGDESQAIPFLKRFTVFNTDQCEDLPTDLAPSAAPVSEGIGLPQAEALIAATGADFRIGGDRAYYSSAADFVQVPRPEAFFEPVNWHRTALHELGHWTGHPSRLARDLSARSPRSCTARKNSAPRWRAHSSAPRSASSRPCAIPIISAPGSTSCGRTTARSSAASAASKAADYLLAFMSGTQPPVAPAAAAK